MSSFWFGSAWYRDSCWNEAQFPMWAWDDFGRFLETTTGKKTLHVTGVITYQIITEEESIYQEPDDGDNLSSEEKT